MGWVSGSSTDQYARPRVIRGTRTAPLPLLPSGPGGVCGRPLHGARDLTSIYRSTRARDNRVTQPPQVMRWYPCQHPPVVKYRSDGWYESRWPATKSHLYLSHFSLDSCDLLMESIDRKSTRLNSSHRCISYAVFC